MHPRLFHSFLAVIVALATTPMVACSAYSEGDVQPGCTDGSCVIVTGMPVPSDGRDISFGNIATNESSSEPATLISVTLIEPVGIKLVDSFTVPPDHQIGIGLPIPPVPADNTPDIAGTAFDIIANWAMRAPLAGSVIVPGDALQLVLILRPTSQDTCRTAKGFNLTYMQGGHRCSVDANMAMYLFDGHDASICNDSEKYLQDHPLR